MKVGFAGAGSMAAALARGWTRRGGPDAMAFADAGSGRAAQLAGETGGEAAEGLEQLAAVSDVILLAVKPGALPAAAEDLSSFSGPIVSVLGATPLASLRRAFPRAPVLRTMPNVAVEVGAGTICHAPPDDAGSLREALALLGRIARLYELPEEQLDAATAVMGCSPAYLALACGALAEAGVEAGLAPALAAELAARSAAGTGELLLERDPAEVARSVASPGGSTEAGLGALAAAGGPAAFRAAVEASLERMAGIR